MRAGLLRHRVDLVQDVDTPDGAGGSTSLPQTLATVWAQIQGLQGRELAEWQQVTASADYSITIRYRADVLPQMRVLDGDRSFEIRSVIDPDGRRRELRLFCQQIRI